MNLTQEQQAIIEATAAGDSCKVMAFAGTGKTATLVHASNTVRAKRVLYVTFSRKMRIDAQREFSGFAGGPLRHVTVKTAHGVAFQGVHSRLRARERLRYKSIVGARRYVMSKMPETIKPLYELGFRRAAPVAVLETIDAFTHSDAAQIAPRHVPEMALLRIPREHREEAAAAVATRAAAVWDRMMDTSADIPITHDVYLKAYQLQQPTLRYDLIMFDEAQDANPAMLALLRSQRAQQLFVGDSHQQVYAWRGAVDAMEEVGFPDLPLTKSWRFGPTIADLACRILQQCKGEKRTLCGNPERDSRAYDGDPHAPADAILARTNAGALREALSALGRGHRVAIVGEADEIAEAIEAAWDLHEGRAVFHHDFALFDSWSDLLMTMDEHPKVAADYGPYARLVDEYGKTIPSMCGQLKRAAVRESQADVVVSTIHRAKGRQWDRVRLAPDCGGIRPVRQHVGGIQFDSDDANLAYVAVTRAKVDLNLAGYLAVLDECFALARRAHHTPHTAATPKAATSRAKPQSVCGEKESWLRRMLRALWSE